MSDCQCEYCRKGDEPLTREEFRQQSDYYESMLDEKDARIAALEAELAAAREAK